MLDVSTNSPKIRLLFFSSNKLEADLAQARADKKIRPEQADRLYEQVEEDLLKLAEQQGMRLTNPEGSLTRRNLAETPKQTALRQCIAEVYFERGEVFDQLKKTVQPREYYQKAQAWGHPDAAMQLNRLLPTSDLRFSLGQLPALPAHYLRREESTQLLTLLKNQPKALIEVVGPALGGKTTLIQHLIRPNPDPFLASYALIAWIDCSSVNRAHADIQAISHTLGHGNLNPQAAMRQVSNYVQQHPRSLLILDGLAPRNLDFVLTWLNPSVWSGQLIYTTTQTLVDTLSQSLERSVEPLPLSLFTPNQAKDLVQQCLPKEPLEGCDFAQVIRMTGGYPGVIQAMCRYYQTSVMFRSFADFLAQPEKHQNMRDSLLSEIVHANLGLLEQEAVTDPVAARAVNLIKQVAWLGDHCVPFTFFVGENQQVDQDVIQMLYDKQLAILDIDRSTQSLKLNPAFLSVVQKRYPSEQRALLEKNIQQLSNVFSYLTDNESAKGRHSQPEDLKPYADLVHTLLFETDATFSLSENPSLRIQVLTLSSSLARLYYLYHGELQLAYDCLQMAHRFFKQGLSAEQIAHFERAPEDFTAPSITHEETKLLKLYAQEYLYQMATIASQLVPRGQVAVEVIQDFEKSCAIQINLGRRGDPEAIAYTLRNLTRALRKQGCLVDALQKYEELTLWMDRHPLVFNERARAELLVDRGIIQKELEDARPEGQRDYQHAIDLLSETHRIYMKYETANQRQPLGMLSIYLGEAYLAAGNFEAGITHTCQILHYDGNRRERQARAYFNLARAFDNTGYGALAKLFIDKALPLQITAYQSTTEALRLKIEQKLLHRHQHTTPHPIDAQTASWETQASLTAYCEAQLSASSAPSKIISRDHIDVIEAKADNWLWQHHSKATFEAQQAALTQKFAALEAEEKAQAEKHALQLQQDELWYRTFVHRVDLDTPKNRHARFFADKFKEALLYQIIQQLRRFNWNETPIDKTALSEKLIQAVSEALPLNKLDATAGITATVDLAAIVHGVTKTLSERSRSNQKAGGARRVAEFVDDPKQRGKSQQASMRIENQIKEMADYAARCWQPVFSERAWDIRDIQTLADYGARRVMDYLKSGTVDMRSSQEMVVFALTTGKANSRLKQSKAGRQWLSLKSRWSVQGFFTKPGIKVWMEEEGQAIYLPYRRVRPSIYGYRFGSPIEARISQYQGPFKSEAEAQQRAEPQAINSVMLPSFNLINSDKNLSALRNKIISAPPSSFNRDLADDSALINALTEIKRDPKLKEELLNLVKRSTVDIEPQKFSANALTTLVKAKVSLTTENLNGIRVPGADLSYGIFDHTQFQNSDLSQVSLRGAWLRGANFAGAHLYQVEFGEMPPLQLGAEVSTCCYSPDGQWLAVATDMGLHLYQQTTGLKTYTLQKNIDKTSVYSLAFSPNNQWLACGKDDGIIELWSIDGDNFALRHRLKEHNYAVISIAFSKESNLLASSDDEIIKLWDLDGDPLFVHTFEAEGAGKVLSVAFSPSKDSKWLASAHQDHTVRLWDIKKGQFVCNLEGHAGAVNSVVFSSDGNWLASASSDTTIKLWKLRHTDARPLCEDTLTGHSYAVTDVAFSPDPKERWLASASIDKTIKLWAVGLNVPQHTFERHSDSVKSVVFSPDGRWLVSSSADKTVRFSQVDIQPLSSLSETDAEIKKLALSPDHKRFISVEANEIVKLWDAQTQTLLHTFEKKNAAAFSPENELILVAHKKIERWSVQATPPKLLSNEFGESPEETIQDVVFSPDAQCLALSRGDGSVELRMYKEGAVSVKGYIEDVVCSTFSPDSKWLAFADYDGAIGLLSVDTEESKFLGGSDEPRNQIYSLAFSPNGAWLASAGRDATVRLWRVDSASLSTRIPIDMPKEYTGSVYSVAFSPNSEWLAFGSADRTLRIWSIADKKCLAVARGISDDISSIVWQDNSSFLTGGDDKAIRLWKIQTNSDGVPEQIHLMWSSRQTVLDTMDVSIEQSNGLSEENISLLTQKIVEESLPTFTRGESISYSKKTSVNYV